MTILVFSLLAIFSFLYMLIIHYYGNKPKTFENFLGTIIIINIVLAFFLSRWWYGFIAIFFVFFMFFLTNIFLSFILPLGSIIFEYETGLRGRKTYTADKLFRKTTQSIWDTFLQQTKKENEINKKRLLEIYSRPEIQSLLKDYKITFDDFENLFKDLKAILPDKTWDIITSQVEIEKLIELRKKNATPYEIIKHYRNVKI